MRFHNRISLQVISSKFLIQIEFDDLDIVKIFSDAFIRRLFRHYLANTTFATFTRVTALYQIQIGKEISIFKNLNVHFYVLKK
jgi:hypothetical protein